MSRAREGVETGIREVQTLLAVAPQDRHDAAVKLHETLGIMRREGQLGSLRDLDLDEGRFKELLEDPRGMVRSVAITVAGRTGDAHWVPALISCVQDDADPFVRTRAVEALGHLGATEAIPLLAEVAETPSHPARYHAVRALGCMCRMTEPTLLRLAFAHDDEVVRRVAVDTIARTAEPDAWERFLASLDQVRSIPVRRSTVEGLGRSRATRAAVPLVRTLLNDPAPEIREAAADALVALGETRTVGALYESALYDAYAVVRPGSGSAWPASGDQTSAGGKVYPVREAAAEALLALGGTRAWEELERPPDDLVALPRRQG